MNNPTVKEQVVISSLSERVSNYTFLAIRIWSVLLMTVDARNNP